MRRTLGLAATLPLIAMACGGCGGDSSRGDRPEPASGTVPTPRLLAAPRGAGEIIVRGEASPASHGPVTLRGRYLVRFEQYAPEDPGLDFGEQTAFVAMLDRRPEQPGADSVRLFRAATRAGRVHVRADGRFWIDVSFGDFPYVIRLTPER